jgi:hypothetical protein
MSHQMQNVEMGNAGATNQYAGPPQTVVVQQNYHVEASSDSFPCCLAYFVLIVNIFLPGIGTMFACCGIRDGEMKAAICYSGVCQLLTAPCIIGWCLAMCYSCMFIGASASGISFEEFYRQHQAKKAMRG